MKFLELLWLASLDELKAGFILRDGYYICLLCGRKFENGIVYNENNVFYEAEKFMKLHIKTCHNSVFDYLINLDKKITGLSQHQKNLLSLFYQNKSDAAIQAETGIGSASTIRNHRFNFREKERQSKIFLALMELLSGKEKNTENEAADEPEIKNSGLFDISSDERIKIIRKYFPEGSNGRLKTFTMKEKSKIVILQEITGRFVKNRMYSEKEVNEILKSIFNDFSTLRRYLIDYGFMERRVDGSGYWLKRDKKEVGSVN